MDAFTVQYPTIEAKRLAACCKPSCTKAGGNCNSASRRMGPTNPEKTHGFWVGSWDILTGNHGFYMINYPKTCCVSEVNHGLDTNETSDLLKFGIRTHPRLSARRISKSRNAGVLTRDLISFRESLELSSLSLNTRSYNFVYR